MDIFSANVNTYGDNPRTPRYRPEPLSRHRGQRENVIDLIGNLQLGQLHKNRPIGATMEGEQMTNPGIGEPGFLSARDMIAGQPWTQYLDALREQGVTNVGRTTRVHAPEPGWSYEGYGDIPGTSSSLPTERDPYYNTPGVGPRYRNSATNERQVLGTDTVNLPTTANARTIGAIRGLQNAIGQHTYARPTTKGWMPR